jgi:hypothetical protein
LIQLQVEVVHKYWSGENNAISLAQLVV